MEMEFTSFLACPTCTFNRFVPSWYFFVLLRLVAVFLVCRGRLDPVRTLGIVALYEIPYFYLWRYSVLDSYAEDFPGYPSHPFAGLFTMAFDLGVFHLVTLVAASGLRFFAPPALTRFTIRRAFLAALLVFGVAFLQNRYAYTIGSSVPG